MTNAHLFYLMTNAYMRTVESFLVFFCQYYFILTWNHPSHIIFKDAQACVYDACDSTLNQQLSAVKSLCGSHFWGDCELSWRFEFLGLWGKLHC